MWLASVLLILDSAEVITIVIIAKSTISETDPSHVYKFTNQSFAVSRLR